MKKRFVLYRLTKWFSYIFIALLMLISILVLTLYTRLGSQAIVSLVQKTLPEQIQIGAFEGRLAHSFKISDFEYLSEDTKISIGEFAFAWKPFELLQKKLDVSLVQIHNTEIVFSANNPTPQNKQTQNFTINLPNLQTNFEAYFPKVDIQHVQFKTDSQTIQINSIQTQAEFKQNQLVINAFLAQTTEGNLSLTGKLAPLNQYPFDLQAQADIQLEELEAFTIHAEFSGHLKNEINLQVELKESIGAFVQGQVKQPLSSDLTWHLKSTLYDLKHDLIQAQMSQFAVQFDGHGDLKQATGNLIGTANLHEYGLISIQAAGDFTAEQAKLSRFYIEANEIGLYANIFGQANLTPEHLSINMQGDTQWQQFPLVEIDLSYEGNFKQADTLQILLTTDYGKMLTQGFISWEQGVLFDVAIETEGIKLEHFQMPIAIRPYLEKSSLESQLKIQGEFNDAKQEVRLAIERLRTELSGEPVSLKAQFEFKDKWINLPLFYLAKGEGSLDVTASGALEALSITTQIDNFDLDSLKIGQANIQLMLDSSFKTLPRGILLFKDLKLAEENEQFTLRHLEVQLVQEETYSATINAEGEAISLHTQLTGNWSNFQWFGTLNTLAWESKRLQTGYWQLENPTELSFTQASYEISPFCLKAAQHDAHICGQLKALTASQETLAELSLKNLRLSLFEPWLPQALKADGSLELSAFFKQKQQQRNFKLQLDMSESALILPDYDLTVTFLGGNILTLEGDENQLTGQAKIDTDLVEGGVRGQFLVDKPFEQPDIEALIQLNLTSLRALSLLTPEIQNASGELNGQFLISGPPDALLFSGNLALCCAKAEIPSAGLNLKDLRFELLSPKTADAPFTLSASAQSGEGAIKLQGDYFLNTHQASLTVQGDRFTAVSNRDINLVISPELAIEIAPKMIKLRGDIHTDTAMIRPPKFDSVLLSSKDTVITRGEDTIWASAPSDNNVDIDISLHLGDKFQVSAYGFDGRLTGGLRILERPRQATSAAGTINVADGRYELYGQALNIDRGTLVYSGGDISNPGLNLRVSRPIDFEQVTVGAQVTGSLQRPNLTLFSTPAMQDAEVLSYLILGRGFGDEAGEDQNMLLQASLALGMQGGNLLGTRLSQSIGVDEIMLDGGDSLESTSLYIGKHLSPRLYIKYGIGLMEPVNTFFIRYRINDFLSFETQTGTLGSGTDLFYSIEK